MFFSLVGADDVKIEFDASMIVKSLLPHSTDGFDIFLFSKEKKESRAAIVALTILHSNVSTRNIKPHYHNEWNSYSIQLLPHHHRSNRINERENIFAWIFLRLCIITQVINFLKQKTYFTDARNNQRAFAQHNSQTERI